MERNQIRVSLFKLQLIAIGLLAGLTSTARAEGHHKPCSNATLKGSYGYYKTGTILDTGGTLVGVGIATFDGNGNSYGTESDNRNGELDLDQNGSGRYQVNPDCTGRLLRDDGEEYSRLVVVNDGRRSLPLQRDQRGLRRRDETQEELI